VNPTVAPLPQTERESRRAALLSSAAFFASILVASIGSLVVVGWELDRPSLKAFLPGRVATNPTSALGLIVAAASLWMHQAPRSEGHRELRRLAARVSAAVVAFLGLATIIGYTTGDNLGVDQILFHDGLGANRIAPNTGITFLLAGVALLLLDWERPSGARPAQLIALVPSAIALTSLFGYAYGVDELYGLADFKPMAFPTWVKIARTGGTFTGSYSADGITWTQLATTNLTMSASATVGLAVTAHSNAESNTATFDNVAIQ